MNEDRALAAPAGCLTTLARMNEALTCPICTMSDIVDTPDHHECLTCGHEWSEELPVDQPRDARDANGNQLTDGDTVTVVKDLKVKGSSMTLKVGTKVSGIRIVAGDHEIESKVDGRAIMLKAKFVKRA